MSPDLLMETAPMSTLSARLGSAPMTRSVTAAVGAMWRALRLVALAVTVIAGGMGVGAFVIAPLVSSDAGRSTTSAAATAAAAPSVTTTRSAAVIDLSDLLSTVGARLARGSRTLLVGLSAGRPVRALVVPGMLLLVAAGAAATLVVLRRRDAELMAVPTRAAGGGTLGGAVRSAAYPAPQLVKATGSTGSRTGSRAAGRTGNRAATKQGHKRLRAISTMAAAGSSTPDIARQIGLSVDAVQLMLAITADERQLQPPAA